MKTNEEPANGSEPVDNSIPEAVVPGELPLSPMLLIGMIVAVCIFMAFGMYCERRKRKRYYQPYKWQNRTTFAVPWFLFQVNSFGEKQSLLSSAKDITINIYTSKNKVDSKYPKIKRKFPYFVTIPEEEEEDDDIDTVRFQNKIYPKSFPHF